MGEELYYRCKPEVIEDPYKTQSIAELSHNRSGTGQSISLPNDVLYSIKVDEDFETYVDKVVCTLVIRDLTPDNRYDKWFEQDKNGRVVCANIQLIHVPETCMYPHCVFRIWLDGVLVTMDNYKTTLGKVNEIRNRLRFEIASMIYNKEVSQAISFSDI